MGLQILAETIHPEVFTRTTRPERGGASLIEGAGVQADDLAVSGLAPAG
jgi:hypothetical protein